MITQKIYPLKVIKKIHECNDACTLVLDPKKEDKDAFTYKPAQFLSFHLNISNQKIIRSYSLSGSPLLNEPLITSIKKVKKGLASPYIVDNVKEGDVIESSPPNGIFFKAPADLKPRHYFIIAGGSGITPVFSIIKTALLSDDQNKVTLIYCNKSESSMIYKNELNKWKNIHANRFQIIHFLSQPQKDDTFNFKGRIDPKKLEDILHQSKSQLQFEYYLCGPIELMKMAKNLFIEHGVERKSIRTENFGSPSKKSSPSFPLRKESQPEKKKDLEEKSLNIPKTAVIIQADSSTGEPVSIKALLEGENIEIPAKKDLPILEQLIDAGFGPPFSCMAGSCMTCMATLKKGRVYQDIAGILAEENIAEKEILTCQAKPLSPIIEVDYDS